jgi:hypothetical protein
MQTFDDFEEMVELETIVPCDVPCVVSEDIFLEGLRCYHSNKEHGQERSLKKTEV